MLVTKEVIRPGTYFYIDPSTGLPKKLVATPEAIKHWHDRGNEMLSVGLSVPLPLEHQLPNPPKPLTAAEKATKQLRDNAGWVSRYELKDGVLFSVCDVLDPAIARKIHRGAIRWTSPYFANFMDGDGRQWDGVIAHLALTSKPRITKQQPFAALSAAMSYVETLPQTQFNAKQLPQDGLILSRAGLLTEKDGKFTPLYPVAFSLWSGGIPLADVPPPKKKPPNGNEPPPPKGDEGSTIKVEGDDKVPAHDPVEPNVSPMNPVEQESLIDPDGDIDVEDVIYELLDIMEIPLPEDANRADLRETVYKALMQAVKAIKKKESAPLADETAPNANREQQNPIIQEQPPMYMSIEQVNAITDPTMKSIAMSLHNSQKQTEALRKNIFEAAKMRRQARVDRLIAKRKNDEFAKTIAAQCSGAGFSLQDDGTVKDEMDGALTLLEMGIPDLPPILATGMFAIDATAQPHPKEEQMTEERRQELVGDLASGLNVRQEKKAG